MTGPDGGGHVLIVEDELVIGLGMQALLETLGYASFAFASTDMQALEQVRLRRPNLVTVDVGLLDGDGVTAAHAIVLECPGVPIVFVTGDPASASAFPGVVVVEKPVGEADLARAVERAQAAAVTKP